MIPIWSLPVTGIWSERTSATGANSHVQWLQVHVPTKTRKTLVVCYAVQVVLATESVDTIIKCEHSNENS